MTKKKIRYSEFPIAGEPAPPAEQPPPKAAAKRAPKSAAARAPVDLARALAAARDMEAATLARVLTPVVATPVVPAPRATTTMSLSRLTPSRGSVAIPAPGLKLTPARGTTAVGATAAAPITEATRSLRERVRQRSGTIELLVFRLGDELFGLDLCTVEEAIDLPPVRHVPEMPPAMLGVITVRGALTSIYSPEFALGLTLASRASALIFKRGLGRVALVVDDVDDVYTLDLAQLRDAPGGDAGDGILLGVLRRDNALLGLVDAEALIAACQAVPVLETA